MTNEEIVKSELQAKFNIELDNFDDILFKAMYELKHAIDNGASINDLRQKYNSTWWTIDITKDGYAQLRLAPETFIKERR